MKNLFFTLIFVGLCLNGLAQSTLEISIDGNRFHVDEQNSLILCQGSLDAFTPLTDSTEVRLLSGGDTYRLVEKQTDLSYQDAYQVQRNNVLYELFFTQLPVMRINSSAPIPDKQKVLANLEYTDDTQQLRAVIGIETRGGFSQSLPKKTYDLEFWEDETDEDTRDVQFGELREDDDWILDALFNEPLRIRSFMSHKLWLSMHELTYADEEPEAKSGADVMWTELFLDSAYQGVYALSEPVDRKLLQLKKFKEGEIRGELFKGEDHGEAIEFRSVPPYDTTGRIWSGYELKYPGKKDTTEWANLYRLVDFVVNSDSTTFGEAVGSRFDLRNAADYFIFLNLIRARDNQGKNIYTARYEANSPYFYVPWDLDGTWGMKWNGTRENVTGDILTNGLYQRLVDQNVPEFNNRLGRRWAELRQETLSDEAIANMTDELHGFLVSNGIYQREQRVWPSYTYDTASIVYLKAWTQERLNFLDLYFDDLVLSADAESEDIPFRVYPNPAMGTINIEGDDIASKTYEILNSYGVVVKAGTVGQSINTRDIPRGYYILRINGAAERILITN